MSDIDKIKKINEMSAVLKKHGFAANNQDAANQAQQVFREKLADAEKPKGADTMSSSNNADVVKVERNLEAFKAAVQQQMEALKGDVHNVIEKMNQMIKAINELEKLKDSVTTIDDNGEKQQRLAPKVVKKANEKGSTSHPRSGDFKPGDIDLNKTFYCGTK